MTDSAVRHALSLFVIFFFSHGSIVKSICARPEATIIEVAGNARKALEKELGKSVVSKENFLKQPNRKSPVENPG